MPRDATGRIDATRCPSLRRAASASLLLIAFSAGSRAEDAASPPARASASATTRGACSLDVDVVRDGQPAAAAVEVRWAPFPRAFDPIEGALVELTVTRAAMIDER